MQDKTDACTQGKIYTTETYMYTKHALKCRREALNDCVLSMSFISSKKWQYGCFDNRDRLTDVLHNCNGLFYSCNQNKEITSCNGLTICSDI